MDDARLGLKLQAGYRELFRRYAPHLTTAATLTLKQYAKIRVRRFENYEHETFEIRKSLDSQIIASTARRFEARLTHHLFGNKAKHQNNRHWAKPLLFVAIEGRNTHKRTHLHIAVGNVPAHKLSDIETHIRQSWHDCDFGDEQVCVRPLQANFGWLDYMTKEVGYTDNDSFAVGHACIPEIIQESICTEGRLLKA
jgi:hypothetical protein